MEVQPDFKELLELFNKHDIEYIIVGGYALAFHGAPRYTGDIDLFINPSKKNAQLVMKALDEFGFGKLDLSIKDFSSPRNVVQLGVPPVRIDLITSITGVQWKDAYRNKVSGSYGNTHVFFLNKNDFIKNKKALSRHKDLADVEALDEKTD